MTPDAASTPGIARKRSTSSRCARRIWAIDGNRCGDSETSAVSTRSALKPRSCERSDAKLAMSSPAPTSRTSAIAISAATSPSRRRRCSRLVPARASSRTAEPSVTSLVCRSGASAHNKPQPSDNAVATASARPSSAIPSARGSSAPAMRTNDSSAIHAIPMPRTPPASGERQHFADQLAREPPARSTKHDPRGDFTATVDAAREQQVRDVGARDEQDGDDGTEQEEERLARRAEHLADERTDHRANTGPRALRPVFLRQRPDRQVERRPSLIERDAACQPSDRDHPLQTTVLQRLGRDCRLHGSPQLALPRDSESRAASRRQSCERRCRASSTARPRSDRRRRATATRRGRSRRRAALRRGDRRRSACGRASARFPAPRRTGAIRREPGAVCGSPTPVSVVEKLTADIEAIDSKALVRVAQSRASR